KALEKLEADHTVIHHVSRSTAHLWLEAPLDRDGDDKKSKLNRMFDSHPPLDERIAILRKLEGLDPEGRGPVDETSTGVPVDLQTLAVSTGLRTSPSLLEVRGPRDGPAVNTPTQPAANPTADDAPMVIP